MKRKVISAWSNPVDIDSWIIGKVLNNFEMARGAGVPQLLLLGNRHFLK